MCNHCGLAHGRQQSKGSSKDAQTYLDILLFYIFDGPFDPVVCLEASLGHF